MRIPMPDETFIVRVRRRERDAVVEQPRLARRQRIQDVADVGAVIDRWLQTTPARRDTAPGREQERDRRPERFRLRSRSTDPGGSGL